MNERQPSGWFYIDLITHDISNFNQTSRGYLEMLLDEQMGPLSEEQIRALTICLRQCHRTQSELDSLRVVRELGQSPPEMEAQDLDEAVQRALERTQQRHADLDIRLRFARARRRVMAEPQLQVVLDHILDNAARYSTQELVEIDVTATRDPDAPEMWLLQIQDNGNGVPAGKREGLFSRLDGPQVHGTGVGLSLARVLVQRWNGDLWLKEPREGQGATFCLKLPAA